MTTPRLSPRVRRRTLLPTAAALAGIALLAGCGSSGTAAAGATRGAGGSTAQYPTVDVVSSITADPKLHAELPASIRSAGTLTLGTTVEPGTSNLPYRGETPSGQQIGVEADIQNAVARVLGVKWKIVNGTFDTIVPGVRNGTYDVGDDNFGVTATREKVVDFATYLNDGQSFLGPTSLNLSRVTNVTDLCGLTIATTPGSTFQEILTSDAAKCAAAGKKPYQVQLFSDDAPIWLGLANGKVDVFFGPTIGVHYDVTRIPNTKFLGQFSTTPVGFVTGKGSPVAKALSDAVNQLISSGDYARILNKWGLSAAGISKSAVNPKPNF